MSYSGSVVVKVPATTANVGVGFDVLGMALDLYNEFVFTPSDSLEIYGCPAEMAGENNLIWRSYVSSCRELGLEARALRIEEKCSIPMSGGLGSSSSCVVAGIAAAQVLNGMALDCQKTLMLAAAAEGHPDNVSPAILGGLVSAFVDETGSVHATSWDVADNLRFVCLSPSYRVLTSEARKAIPKSFPTEVVSWQVGRSLALVRAMGEGDAEAIRACCHDRVHEPYRAPLIPDYQRLRRTALDAGACAFLISGSGATMIAVTDNDRGAKDVADACASAGVDGLWVRILHCSLSGVAASRS